MGQETIVGELNNIQKKLLLGTALLALLAFLFPPLNLERRPLIYVDSNHYNEAVSIRFVGWGFIGQSDYEPKPKKKQWPKDRSKMSALDRFEEAGERFEAQRPSVMESRNVGKKKINFRILGIEILLLSAISGAALFVTRTKNPTLNRSDGI